MTHVIVFSSIRTTNRATTFVLCRLVLVAVFVPMKVLAFTTPSLRIYRDHDACRAKVVHHELYMAKSDMEEKVIRVSQTPDINDWPVTGQASESKSNIIKENIDAMELSAIIEDTDDVDSEYNQGLLTIGFITLLFSSNSPALHAAFSGSDPPPVLLLNAAVSIVALVGLLLGGKSLESNTPLPSTMKSSGENDDALALQGGIELGLWKMLGTTANLYGLALTTAGHGALLIQLTTLIVPVVQGIQGVPIPRKIQFSVVLALVGVVCFTQDPTGTPSSQGDALCVLAAIFYATYDLRLFQWGKKVVPRRLITTKIGTQAMLSAALLFSVGRQESFHYLTSSSLDPNWAMIVPLVIWSGVAVNAVAPFLQVGGQQAVGPTRCQTIYASQPLWAAILSFFFLGETVGVQGLVGGSAFLSALFLASTAEAPDPNCGVDNCEV